MLRSAVLQLRRGWPPQCYKFKHNASGKVRQIDFQYSSGLTFTCFRLQKRRVQLAIPLSKLCPRLAARIAGHADTSHVTRHTSHVTRHTSDATLHTSHVTRVSVTCELFITNLKRQNKLKIACCASCGSDQQLHCCILRVRLISSEHRIRRVIM